MSWKLSEPNSPKEARIYLQQCKSCHRWLPLLTHFHQDASRHGFRDNRCKECESARWDLRVWRKLCAVFLIMGNQCHDCNALRYEGARWGFWKWDAKAKNVRTMLMQPYHKLLPHIYGSWLLCPTCYAHRVSIKERKAC